MRGKYYKRILAEGANVVMLEPDVAKAFADSAAVNEALRSPLDLTKTTAPNTYKAPGCQETNGSWGEEKRGQATFLRRRNERCRGYIED